MPLDYDAARIQLEAGYLDYESSVKADVARSNAIQNQQQFITAEQQALNRLRQSGAITSETVPGGSTAGNGAATNAAKASQYTAQGSVDDVARLANAYRALGVVTTLYQLFEQIQATTANQNTFYLLNRAEREGRELTEAEKAQIRENNEKQPFLWLTDPAVREAKKLLDRITEPGDDELTAPQTGFGDIPGSLDGAIPQTGSPQTGKKGPGSTPSPGPGGSPSPGPGGSPSPGPGGSPSPGPGGSPSPGPGGSPSPSPSPGPGGSPSPGPGGSFFPGGAPSPGPSPGGRAPGGSSAPGRAPGGTLPGGDQGMPYAPPGGPGGSGSQGGPGSGNESKRAIASYQVTIGTRSNYWYNADNESFTVNEITLEVPVLGSIYTERVQLGSSTTYSGFNTSITLQDWQERTYYSYQDPVTGAMVNTPILTTTQQVVFDNYEPEERRSVGEARVLYNKPVYVGGGVAVPEAPPGSRPGTNPSPKSPPSPNSEPERKSPPLPDPGNLPRRSPQPGGLPGTTPNPGSTPNPNPGSTPGPSPGPSPSPSPNSPPGKNPGDSPGSPNAPNSPPGSSPGSTPSPGTGTGTGSGINPWNFIPPVMPSTGPGSRTTPNVGNSPGSTPTPEKAPTPTNTPTTTKPTEPTVCRYDSANISGDVKIANKKLDALGVVLEGIQTVQLANISAVTNSIDNKLGPQIGNGGISGFLKRLWDRSNISKILEILTFITVLHNAYMLSNALTQTLFSAFDNVLEMFGVELKDSEGRNIDTNNWVGNQIKNFFKTIFGAEVVDGTIEAWKKYNRIYQAAANIINSIQSISYSILEALETVGNYVAKIGNAARKAGTVLENAYGWMNPNLNFMNGRFFRWMNGTQEVVDAIEEVTSETLDIVETSRELKKQSDELSKELGIGEEKVKKSEEQIKQASQAPEINTDQEKRAD